ncbi:DIS3-like exonuclease 2 [Chlorella vulgaris]
MRAVTLPGCTAMAARRTPAAAPRRCSRSGLSTAAPAPQRHSLQRLQQLLPCRAMTDSDGEEDELDLQQQQQQQQQRQAAATQRQAAARARHEEEEQVEAASASSYTAEAAAQHGAPAASHREVQHRQAVALPHSAAAADASEPDMGQAWKMGLGGVVALAAFAGLGFLGHRIFKSKTVTDAVAGVQQTIQSRGLAKEAQTRLNEFMSTLRNMSTADLSAKNLGDEGFAYVVDALSFNDRCVAADFSKNGIGSAGAGQLCQVLTNNEGLKTLLLDTNALGDEGAAMLAATLAGGSRITNLNLSGNNIGDAGAKALAEMLKTNTTLEVLELNGNVIDLEGATALAEALTHNTSLKTLGISDNYVQTEGAKVLADALKENSTLQELYIKGNELGDEGVQALCEALKGHKELKALDFGNNSMGKQGAYALADLLRGSTSVTDVNINMNDVGDDGAFQLAASIKDNRSLKLLDVGGNNIAEQGAKALAAALKGNEELRSLELSYNPIGAEGAKAFAEIIKYDMKLEVLGMGWCKVGNGDGVKAVADMLMYNQTIRRLDLRGNGLGNDGAIWFSRGFKEHANEALRELELGYNEIKDEGACALAQALKANPDGAPKEFKINSNYITKFGQEAIHSIMAPPPPPPPGLAPRRPQPNQNTTPEGDRGSEPRPYWRNKSRSDESRTPLPPPGPRHGAPSPYFAGQPSPQPGHGGYTPPPPPPSSNRGAGRGGGGRGGQSAALATPNSAPRGQYQQQQQRYSSGTATPGSYGSGGGGSQGNGSYGTPPRFGSSFGSSGGGGSGGGTPSGSARKPGRRSAYFEEHLPGSLLQQGLKGGMLFRASFRTNAADRTQGYCTVPGLPTDVNIRGLKQQNRAVEGDEVAIRILPPSQWYQLSSSKQAAGRSPGQASTPGSGATGTNARNGGSAVKSQQQQQQLGVGSPSPPPAAARGNNVVPLPSRLAAAAHGGGAGHHRRPLGDLVASPALLPSASGGELGVATGLGGDYDSSSESGSSSADSSEEEEGAVERDQEAMLAVEEEHVEGLHLDTDIAALLAADSTSTAGSPSSLAGAAVTPTSAAVGPKPEATPTPQPAAVQQQAGQQQQQQQQEGKEEGEEDGPESMADFLVREMQQVTVQDAVPQQQNPAGTGQVSKAPQAFSDPRLPCWYPLGAEPGSAQAYIAEQLKQLEGWRATGEVVAVMEPSRRRESVVGVLKQDGERDTGTVFLHPCDPRLPRMMVRTTMLPPALREVLTAESQTAELAARTLVNARVTAWEAGYPFPLAQVRSSLGQAGDLASETAALLSMEQVVDDDQFSPEVLACLPPTPWTISDEEVGRRRDFRHQRVFSIDPPTARDLDDALSVEELPGGGYRVGVHIADVSHFVLPGTALDREAQDRSTSVYLVDRVIPMLPRLLCEELCSLNPGVDRLAFSVVWDMSAGGDILSTWAGRSVIRTCGKLAYPHVQSMIEGRYSALEGQQPPCELSGGHTWPEVVKDSLTLNNIARSLRQRRFDGGALRLDNTRLYFKLDAEGNPCDYGVYEQREANQLVEEFMLLANMTTARMVAEAFPDRALLRCHPPPSMHKMVELAASAAELGFTLDTSGAGPLQRTLTALRESPSVDPGTLEVITLLATKPMQNARYFCTGETPDESFWRHFALAVTHYTHFTSPIRRYPDIVVHRLMAALLDQSAGSSAEQRAQRHGLAGTREVSIVATHANERKAGAKNVQDGSLRLYLCVMLHRQPLVCDAVIMQLGGSRFFDAYIPALGCDVRIHTATLLRGGEAAIRTGWRPEDKTLELRHSVADPGQRGEDCDPDYSDIPNLAALRNLGGICATDLPFTLHVLSHIPIVVSSRRSPTSGSPTNVIAKLWLNPTPSASSGKQGAAALQPQAQQAQQQQQLQQQPAGLRMAMAQGIQESFD